MYVFHENFREIDFTKKCAALSDLDDNEITTEAGAFYVDGLNILRLCLQAAQERNSADTLLYYYVTTGLLAFQRITVSLLLYLLFHAFAILGVFYKYISMYLYLSIPVSLLTYDGSALPEFRF